jgi:hypothetical protein
MINREIQTNYSDFLNKQEWDWFGSFTTPYILSLKSSRSAMERFQSRLKQQLGGCLGFWVAEKGKQSYGYHLHALLSFRDKQLTKQLNTFVRIKQAWQIVMNAKNDKNCRVDLKKYNPKLGASRYITKEIWNDKIDYDLFY